jgi:hypothetical protein
MRYKNLFSIDNLGPRDQEMQRRGGLEEDSDYEEGVDMVPDNMCQGSVFRAQVHIPPSYCHYNYIILCSYCYDQYILLSFCVSHCPIVSLP